VAAARPNASVWQMNGSWRGPEKIGPSIGWLTTRSCARRPPATAVTRCGPLVRPVNSASEEPSGCGYTDAGLGRPSTSSRTWSVPVTRTSTSPPLTKDGRGLETAMMER
jgi:hypothetical protein